MLGESVVDGLMDLPKLNFGIVVPLAFCIELLRSQFAKIGGRLGETIGKPTEAKESGRKRNPILLHATPHRRRPRHRLPFQQPDFPPPPACWFLLASSSPNTSLSVSRTAAESACDCVTSMPPTPGAWTPTTILSSPCRRVLLFEGREQGRDQASAISFLPRLRASLLGLLRIGVEILPCDPPCLASSTRNPILPDLSLQSVSGPSSPLPMESNAPKRAPSKINTDNNHPSHEDNPNALNGGGAATLQDVAEHQHEEAPAVSAAAAPPPPEERPAQLEDEEEGNTPNRTSSSRTPFTGLSQVDADWALARTLQEQVLDSHPHLHFDLNR
ncbi:hypothetical protein CDL15_Pgr008043 [Punica granatum]|uniref:Uncharacterized protein n=1 Tax=Punica granatum TaxID=22663 RepID=A0A218VRG6_PUNGR|nr:hypothetical protein CDL15_Pgr008043 [Punica granatum]